MEYFLNNLNVIDFWWGVNKYQVYKIHLIYANVKYSKSKNWSIIELGKII